MYRTSVDLDHERGANNEEFKDNHDSDGSSISSSERVGSYRSSLSASHTSMKVEMHSN